MLGVGLMDIKMKNKFNRISFFFAGALTVVIIYGICAFFERVLDQSANIKNRVYSRAVIAHMNDSKPALLRGVSTSSFRGEFLKELEIVYHKNTSLFPEQELAVGFKFNEYDVDIFIFIPPDDKNLPVLKLGSFSR